MKTQIEKILNGFKESDFDISILGKKTFSSEFNIANGDLEKNNKLFDQGILIEVSRDSKVYRKALSLINEKLIIEQINYAIKCLENFQGSFIDNSYYQISTKRLIQQDSIKGIDKSQEEEIVKFFKDLTKLNNSWVTSIRSVFNSTFEERFIINNRGGYFFDQNNFIGLFHNVVGEKNSIIQNRSNAGEFFKGVVNKDFFNSIKFQNEIIHEELSHLLDAKPCPKMNADLVLPPDQMYIQIHESIGHPLELDRILGDERNYAGGSFVKKQDFGSLRYGPEIMNVTFNPDLDYMPASQAFDDTGTPTKKIHLIENGILKAGIGGMESQARLGVEGSISTRNTNWNRPPIDRMGNINLEVGESSFEEIIQSTENGILMKSNSSWSIDDQRDKFQFGCEYAQLIKDGELKEVVRAPCYEGRTISFWNSLQMVGDSNTLKAIGTPYCGKGEPNQIIRVGHQSPTCKFKNISIFCGE